MIVFFKEDFCLITKDKLRAKKMGIDNLNKKYQLNEIVSGDSIFCATGITWRFGFWYKNRYTFKSETLITHKSSNLEKFINLRYNIE